MTSVTEMDGQVRFWWWWYHSLSLHGCDNYCLFIFFNHLLEFSFRFQI